MMFLRSILILLALGLATLIWGWISATSPPVVREAEVRLADWPAGAEPVRAVLVSDIHVSGPDMPPERLEEIVAQINGLEPDLVLIAGDLISDKRSATRLYRFDEALAPLAGLAPRIGAFAVLGNHDHWRDAGDAAEHLRRAGVRLLVNEAVAAGPLALGGLDDPYIGRHDVRGTARAMRALPGAKVLLSHSPDPFPNLPAEIGLMLAGHTHCGQIRLPLIGAVSTMSAYGERYACGWIAENGRQLIVTAGVGTSIVPLRIGAPPDIWLITLRGR